MLQKSEENILQVNDLMVTLYATCEKKWILYILEEEKTHIREFTVKRRKLL
jgi:hypothetical protein